MSGYEETWQQFADSVGGRLVWNERGWLFKRREPRFVAPVGRWSLTLSTFTSPPGDP